MQIHAQHRGDGTYEVRGSVSGTSIIVDTNQRSPEGPAAKGPRPMELVLFGAATCPAVDLVQILEKMRHPADDLIVEVEGVRAAEDPHRFTEIALHFRIFGQGIPLEAAQRAVQLSVEKYCSVLASMNAEIRWTVTVPPAQVPDGED